MLLMDRPLSNDDRAVDEVLLGPDTDSDSQALEAAVVDTDTGGIRVWSDVFVFVLELIEADAMVGKLEALIGATAIPVPALFSAVASDCRFSRASSEGRRKG
jgi:hypothetical protein